MGIETRETTTNLEKTNWRERFVGARHAVPLRNPISRKGEVERPEPPAERGWQQMIVPREKEQGGQREKASEQTKGNPRTGQPLLLPKIDANPERGYAGEQTAAAQQTERPTIDQ